LIGPSRSNAKRFSFLIRKAASATRQEMRNLLVRAKFRRA
jgi:hypothetical protein